MITSLNLLLLAVLLCGITLMFRRYGPLLLAALTRRSVCALPFTPPSETAVTALSDYRRRRTPPPMFNQCPVTNLLRAA